MLPLARSFCALRVGVVGINAKTGDLKLREAIARGAQSLAEEKGLFFRHPTVLLSTCNRTEVYFHADELAEAHSDVLAWLRASIDPPFDQRLYSYFGIDCFTHLCRVAAGLDSAILAETEIQRQVKVAYGQAAARHPLPGCIHYIFQKALKVGKEARNHWRLQRGAPTLYGALWQIAHQFFPDLPSRRILLVGYSETNRGFAAFLNHKGIGNFSFATRTPPLVREAREFCSRSELSRWQDYDWIVSATRSDDYLIRGSSHRRHLLFDLSVPRTIDPDAAQSPAIQLFNIEQINRLIETQRCGPSDSAAKCEAHVAEHVSRLARIFRAKAERLQILTVGGSELA